MINVHKNMTRTLLPDPVTGWNIDILRDDPGEGEDDSLTTRLRGCTEMRFTRVDEKYRGEVRVEELRHHSKYQVLGFVTDNIGPEGEYKSHHFHSSRMRFFIVVSDNESGKAETWGKAQEYAQKLCLDYNSRFFDDQKSQNKRKR